ncbi:MAG: hypothetical protein GX616_22580 [Planctomycetes bacterium]|nr:hypothetical protein [Planctomycetota bacterium]
MKKVMFAIVSVGTVFACGCCMPKLGCCTAGVLVDLLALLMGATAA